jgi:hypothetical protein
VIAAYLVDDGKPMIDQFLAIPVFVMPVAALAHRQNTEQDQMSFGQTAAIHPISTSLQRSDRSSDP